jgi:hypothetical protein
MKTDGTEDQVILANDQNSSLSGFFLDGDTIYYVRQNSLFRMRAILTLQYRQGWIYLAVGNFRILGSGNIDKLRIDGTGENGLTTARANSLYFAGDTLYYNHAWEGNSRLDRMEMK